MFPKIKMVPAFGNPISLNKKQIPKINLHFYYNYLGNSHSKRNISKSNINNASNNSFSKGSKIYDTSTKNNTINNSYFNNKLYYYPPHKNKFSYFYNLSSKAGFLYDDYNFNKAPSLKKNFHVIHKMMKDKRINKINYLNNIFSLSLTGNNFPHSFSIKNKEIEINNNYATNKLLNKTNSSGDIKSKTLSTFLI